MSRFAIRNPYFIDLVCPITTVAGIITLPRMSANIFTSFGIGRTLRVVPLSLIGLAFPPGLLGIMSLSSEMLADITKPASILIARVRYPYRPAAQVEIMCRQRVLRASGVRRGRAAELRIMERIDGAGGLRAGASESPFSRQEALN